MKRLVPRKLAAGILAGALAMLFLNQPLWAHHSNNLFDNVKPLTLEGQVKDFHWHNPHAYIQLMVAGTGDTETEWSVEMAAPIYLYNLGWRPSTLKPGDKVSVTIWPLRNGAAGGLAREVLDAEGMRIGRRP